MGWTPLEPGVYLHVRDESATEVTVLGMASDVMQSSNVVWVY
jgi:hypothetical protein